MVFTTLDIITRRGLLEKGLPIHYYSEYLYHGSSALRELSFDSLQVVNTVSLPINSYGAVDLPSDYQDEVAVCFSGSGVLQQIPHNYTINPLRVHNTTTGAFEPQTTQDEIDVDSSIFFGGNGWLWFWNVNNFGEPTGRFFGAKGGTQLGYTVIPERRQIQLTGGFTDGSIVLQYISDGQNADSATQIDTAAFAVIRAYQEWKRSPNADNENSPEGRAFYNQRRLFRARKNSLNKTDIQNILRNAYTATLKS